MKNVVPMPGPNQVDEEAGAWIARIDRGLSKPEEQQLVLWLAAKEENRESFKSLANLWDGMDDLSRLSGLFPEAREDTSSKGPSNKAGRMAAAACCVIVCLAGLLYGYPRSTPSLEKNYETSVGEQSTVSLADGSQLVINTNSLVTVAYDEGNRLLTLKRGEIHIDVAHDKTRPLSVKAGHKVFQAVGTAFNVEMLANKQLELIVTDGKVRVGDRSKFEAQLANRQKQSDESPKSKINDVTAAVRLPEQTMSVSKGEKVVLGLPRPAAIELELIALPTPVKLTPQDIQTTLSWRRGSLAFDGETLEQAISEISRYTSAKFELEGDDVKRVRIAGVFKSGDINGFLLALEDTFQISSRKTGKEHFTLYSEL